MSSYSEITHHKQREIEYRADMQWMYPVNAMHVHLYKLAVVHIWMEQFHIMPAFFEHIKGNFWYYRIMPE